MSSSAMAAMPAITWKQPTVIRITAANSAQPIAHPLGSFWLKVSSTGFMARRTGATWEERYGGKGSRESPSVGDWSCGGRRLIDVPGWGARFW